MDPTCVWIGLVCFTEVGFGDSGSAVRWCVDQRLNRSKVEGKLTVGLPKARWSNYREGSAMRWARRDRSGLDRCLVRWSAFLSLSRSFGSLSSFFLSLSLSLLHVEGNGLKVKLICKTISRSNEQNFGQTEITFRKFYFP